MIISSYERTMIIKKIKMTVHHVIPKFHIVLGKTNKNNKILSTHITHEICICRKYKFYIRILPTRCVNPLQAGEFLG